MKACAEHRLDSVSLKIQDGFAVTVVLASPTGYSSNTPDVSSTFNAPLTNEHYSKISGDFNPIHVNPYFSDFASLPATITHGMWSSAATHCYVESIVAQGHPDRMIA
jgi:fatty acid synthase subunit alpha, fungi type